MVNRRGMDKGRGKGYRNIIGKDSRVHSLSAKGIKQPQKAKKLNIKIDPDDFTWEQWEKRYGELTADDFEIDNLFPEPKNYGVTCTFDEFGDIKYPNGLGQAIEELGGIKLSKKEILRTFLNESADDDEIYHELSKYQEDNTYNYDPPLSDIYNYGVVKDFPKVYFIFKTHLGGDVRGNYTDYEVYDISNVDTGATGKPSIDLIAGLLQPRVMIEGNFKGKRADYAYMGGQGFDTTDTRQPKIEEDFGVMYEKLKNYATKKYG